MRPPAAPVRMPHTSRRPTPRKRGKSRSPSRSHRHAKKAHQPERGGGAAYGAAEPACQCRRRQLAPAYSDVQRCASQSASAVPPTKRDGSPTAPRQDKKKTFPSCSSRVVRAHTHNAETKIDGLARRAHTAHGRLGHLGGRRPRLSSVGGRRARERLALPAGHHLRAA